jgi:hypothetical protein
MILNFAILGLVRLGTTCKVRIVPDVNRNALHVALEQHVIHALSVILSLQEASAIQSVVMEAEMTVKNVTMEILKTKMAVRVAVMLRTTLFACLSTPPPWAQMFASAMQSRCLLLGLSIGVPLRSSSDLKLNTMLRMAPSRLMLKYSALKYWNLLFSTIKILEQNTTASWM